MISIIGRAIKDDIIEEIYTAKFFTILANKVTDFANLEQVSLVLRFVNCDRCIKEEFVGFITVERITGKVLATLGLRSTT